MLISIDISIDMECQVCVGRLFPGERSDLKLFSNLPTHPLARNAHLCKLHSLAGVERERKFKRI